MSARWAACTSQRIALCWRSKARKCGVRGSGILWIGFDEDVEIFSGARLGVEGNGVASDDEVLNAVGVEGPQQFFEVGEHPAELLSWRKRRA
jgi:hypothetical protein